MVVWAGGGVGWWLFCFILYYNGSTVVESNYHFGRRQKARLLIMFFFSTRGFLDSFVHIILCILLRDSEKPSYTASPYHLCAKLR